MKSGCHASTRTRVERQVKIQILRVKPFLGDGAFAIRNRDMESGIGRKLGRILYGDGDSVEGARFCLAQDDLAVGGIRFGPPGQS